MEDEHQNKIHFLDNMSQTRETKIKKKKKKRILGYLPFQNVPD